MFGMMVLGVLAFGAAGYICVLIISSIKEGKEERRFEEAKRRAEEERQLEEKKRRIQRARATLNALQGNFNLLEGSVESQLRESFYFTSSCTHSEGHWDKVYAGVNKTISDMQGIISAMKIANSTLFKEAHEENRYEAIERESLRVIPKARKLAEDYKAFGQRVENQPIIFVLNLENYGRVNEEFWHAVSEMTCDEAREYIQNCESLLSSTYFDELFKIDPEKVMKCLWVFATARPISTADLERAKAVVGRVFKYTHPECTIADLYVQKTLGMDNALRDPVRNLLEKFKYAGHWLHIFASSFMWMNAYQAEQTVLLHMLKEKLEMDPKLQDRLQSLSAGTGNAPDIFSVTSSASELYFDISALAWRDNDYVAFFDRLAFQDQQLTYSLAVRDENKDLFIPQGISLPEPAVMLNRIKAIFAEEYVAEAEAKAVKCFATSGAGKEEMDGILAVASACKQMGVLIHVAKIGKRLAIKFYTLAMPVDANRNAQKQQALSLYQKLSPTVTMWESSLKDTMLMAIEQSLNATTQTDVGGSGVTFEEPMF